MLNIQSEQGFTPQALQNRPKLSEAETYYFKAFNELSASRPSGDSPGAIPESEYHAHFQMWDIKDHEEKETFLRYLRAMDSAYVNHIIEKMKKQNK